MIADADLPSSERIRLQIADVRVQVTACIKAGTVDDDLLDLVESAIDILEVTGRQMAVDANKAPDPQPLEELAQDYLDLAVVMEDLLNLLCTGKFSEVELLWADFDAGMARLKKGAVESAAAEPAPVEVDLEFPDYLEADSNEVRNLRRLRKARDGVLQGTLPIRQFKAIVNKILRNTNNAQRFMHLKLTPALPSDEVDLVKDSSARLQDLKEGLEMMLAFVDSGDRVQLNAGLEKVSLAMATIRTLRQQALAIVAAKTSRK